MNELMVGLSSAGWLYYRTAAKSTSSALEELRGVCESNGVNIDNVTVDSAILRDSDCNDIDDAVAGDV